jgi:hypothetical protein
VSGQARVTIAEGAEGVGLATMLADLISQNLAQKSRKWVDFNRLDAAISIRVTDADVAVMLLFSRGSLAIHVNTPSPSGIRIAAPAEMILALCTVRVVRGIPRLFDRTGLRILKSLLAGKLRIGGLARHPIQLVYFTRLMSVNE